MVQNFTTSLLCNGAPKHNESFYFSFMVVVWQHLLIRHTLDVMHIENKYVKVCFAPSLDKKTQSRCDMTCKLKEFDNIYG
jgi:hypothetical protein